VKVPGEFVGRDIVARLPYFSRSCLHINGFAVREVFTCSRQCSL
jgi:hypothetical protein